jgi:Na+/H+ antiporter NhaC
MVVFIIAFNFDFSRMKKYEQRVGNNEEKIQSQDEISKESRGKVIDLVAPILSLIVFCVGSMIYTGYMAGANNLKDAFANCDAATALSVGGVLTIIFTALLYLPRKILKPSEFANSFPEGFKAMVPAILILTFAWTLGGICSEEYLDAGSYVGELVANSSLTMELLPAIFFLVSLGLAFSTGTSWGTFAILLPIIVSIFGVETAGTLFVISVSAMLAGAVCGDHISPISDTTILSSAGARCNHIDHVSTQIPYALLVCAVCFVGYLISGFTGNGYLGLTAGAILLIGWLTLIFLRQRKTEKV